MTRKELDYARVLRGLDTAVAQVADTMGPVGQRKGYDIASSIELRGAAEQYGVDLVRGVTTKMKTDIGDGSTTAAVLMKGLLDKSLPLVACGVAKRDELGFGIKVAVAKVMDELGMQRERVDETQALRIAARHAGVDDAVARELTNELTKLTKPFENVKVEIDRASAHPLIVDRGLVRVSGNDAEERARRLREMLRIADFTLKEGVVVGGGEAYARAVRALDTIKLKPAQMMGVQSVKHALLQPKLHLGKNVDLLPGDVYDPVATVRVALETAADATNTAFSDVSTRVLRGGVGVVRGAGERVTRYTDIYCQRRVCVNTERFPVVVSLTIDKKSKEAEKLDLASDKPVLVVVSATGCEPLERPEQELQIKPGEDSKVTFFFRPRAIGPGSIRVRLLQDGQPLASPVIPIEVTAFEVPLERSEAKAPLQSVVFENPPDYCLYVEYSHPLLQFVLIPHGGGSMLFERTLHATLKEMMEPFYAKLEGYRAGRTDPVALARGEVRSLSPDAVKRYIRSDCRDLWAQLIPAELKQFYGERRAEIADKSLVVISNEPWIPWELMWPFTNDWTDPGPWCETLRLTRWLLPIAEEKRAPGAPPNRLRLRRMTTIIPKNDDLPVTEREKTFLQQFRKRNGVAQAGVEHPTEDSVSAALENDEYDWVHAATHGNAAVKGGGDAPLWLEDGSSIVPTRLAGPEIAGRIARRQPAFIFNACQVGMGGWTVQGLAGWASALVAANAGLFIAPLWSVTDDLAEKFIREFYVRLEKHETIAEAVRNARKAADSDEGDPTRLAYSVYAHPNATVELGAQKPRQRPPTGKPIARRHVAKP